MFATKATKATTESASAETSAKTSAAGYLSREQILAAPDIGIEDVNVPEWGGVVRVQALSGTERDRFEAALMSARTGKGKNRNRGREMNLENFRARLVAASVVDAHGERMFNDADVRALGQKSAAALGRVLDVAQRLSGLTEEDADELVGE